MRAQLYSTFREACLARGLLADDNIWVNTLNEVVNVASPAKIRKTFFTTHIHGEHNNSAQLWANLKDDMMQDFLRHHEPEQAEHTVLERIQVMLIEFGKVLSDFDLPLLNMI